MSGEPIPALTNDPAYPALLFLSPFGPERFICFFLTIPMSGEPVPILTSDSAYSAILYPKPFGLERDYYLAYSVRNSLLYLLVTLCTQ